MEPHELRDRDPPASVGEFPASLASTRKTAAGLWYLKPTTERLFSYAFEPPPGTPWESGEYELRDTCIADARIALRNCSIHREGFELRSAPTAVQDFFDDIAVKTIYYAEAAELALAVTGGKHAYVFDHLIRRRGRDRGPLSFGRRASGQASANGRIHNDYTEASGRKRLGLVLGDVAATRTGRYAIVNIWRSIKGPIVDAPLAVCDARTVDSADLMPGEVRYPHRTGEIYLVTHSRRHRWYYFDRMAQHESLVFKQYDSQVSGVARFTPHAAFDHPETPKNAPPRESIELRCLVVFEDDKP